MPDLETMEFIVRSENTSHKRVIDVVLTPKGKKVLESCDSTVAYIQKQMISGMTNSELIQLSSLLRGCAERLESIT
jgi:DNA-binding MarR family transcriptional regulator